MTKNIKGMFDIKDRKATISVGDGKKIRSSKVGKWKGAFVDKSGKKHVIILDEVQYVPDIIVNLFSLTRALKKGFVIEVSRVNLLVFHLAVDHK